MFHEIINTNILVKEMRSEKNSGKHSGVENAHGRLKDIKVLNLVISPANEGDQIALNSVAVPLIKFDSNHRIS